MRRFSFLLPTVFRKCCGAWGNLCLLLGSSWEAGKEKINSGCLGFLARPEPGGLPGSFPYMARRLWAGSLLLRFPTLHHH